MRADGSWVAVGVVCLAALVGMTVGLGLGLYAALAFVVVAGLVVLSSKVPSRYFALVVIGILCLAPWQLLGVVNRAIWRFPLVYTVPALAFLALVRGDLKGMPARHLLIGACAIGWTMLGFGLGIGSIGLILKWSVLWGLGMGLYCLMSVKGARAILVRWLPVMGGIVAAYVVVETATKRNMLYAGTVARWVEPQFLASDTFRPTGLMGHPLTVADFLGFAIVITFVALRINWTNRKTLVPLLLVEGAALVLTGGRGALLSTTLAVIVVFAVSSDAFGGRMRSVMLTVVVGAIMWMVFGDVLVARFSGVSQSRSFLQRVAGLAAAAVVIRDSPLFGRGAGYGSFALQELGYKIINYETEWAGLLIGLGVPGTVLALSTPLLSVKEAMSLRWRGPAREIALGCAVYASTMVGTHNLFEWWGGALVFWACVAFSVPDRDFAPEANCGAVLTS